MNLIDGRPIASKFCEDLVDATNVLEVGIGQDTLAWSGGIDEGLAKHR